MTPQLRGLQSPEVTESPALFLSKHTREACGARRAANRSSAVTKNQEIDQPKCGFTYTGVRKELVAAEAVNSHSSAHRPTLKHPAVRWIGPNNEVAAFVVLIVPIRTGPH